MNEPLLDLFGEPARTPALSQFFTPMPIARRMAGRVPPTKKVLEPSAGRGNLIQALIERGHPPELITAIEVDPRWIPVLRQNFPGVNIINADFLDVGFWESFDVVLMNCPFEGDFPERFIIKSLELAPRIWGVFKDDVEFCGRDETIWEPLARVTHRVKVPKRVKYGGDFTASFNTVVLDIVRRDKPRAADALEVVTTEVWKL